MSLATPTGLPCRHVGLIASDVDVGGRKQLHHLVKHMAKELECGIVRWAQVTAVHTFDNCIVGRLAQGGRV